jgi:hypothetical protein
MEEISSSETSEKTGTTWCYNPQDNILHNSRRSQPQESPGYDLITGRILKEIKKRASSI